MNLIAAVDRNWAIGNEGQLLISLNGDMSHFRSLTKDKIVIYGRKTLPTFPNQEPLKDRINIILTHDKNFKVPNAYTVNSILELLTICKSFKSEDIFVIGGQSVYEQLLPLCDTAYITKIDFTAMQADAFMPNLDKYDKLWKERFSESHKEAGFQYYFSTYYRIKDK